MRHSVAPNRTSQGTSLNTQASSSAALAKLLEKKKEFDAVSALERASTLYLERIEGLAEDCDIMANAGYVHGQVLAQWPQMFQILSLFLAPHEQSNKQQEEMSPNAQVTGQRLVRLPLDDLQPATSESR